MRFSFAIAFLVAGGTTFAVWMPRPVADPSYLSWRFVPLGELPGGNYCSTARGVSADGSVVVGYGMTNAGSEAFRWNSHDGMVGLGFPDAFAVSADGSTVVGYRQIKGGSEPVRWTHAGVQGLGNIADYLD